MSRSKHKTYLGTHRRVGQGDEDQNSPDNGQASYNDKECLPWVDWRVGNVRQAKGQQARDAQLDTLLAVPPANDQGVLFAPVVHDGEGHQCRLDRTAR